jgi:ribose-phosphate pyrophosphokinase
VTLLIAVPGSEDHAQRLGTRLGLEVLVSQISQFPDGELYVRLPRATLDDTVAIVGNLSHDNFLRVAFLAGTARDLGAKTVGLVAPYLAYMRQDAVFHAGEGVTQRYFAKLVSSCVDWMVTVDPHLHRVHTLDGIYSIPTTIARAAPAIAKYIAERTTTPVLVGPDLESEQWVAAVAAHCGAPFVILEKTRRGDRDVSVSAPDYPWNGRTPILIDDIVSTGRTLVEATKMLRAAGSAPPACIAIHAVFADAAQEALVAAGASGIVTCNTIPHASNRICVADSIADAVRVRL